MGMKLGFIGGKKPAELPRAARFAADNGFEGLEFDYWKDFREITDETIDAMRRGLDEAGVGVSAYGLWGMNYIAPDESERADAQALLNRAIDYAERLGAAVVVLGTGDIPGAPFAQKLAELCKVMPPFLERIEQAGMRSAFYAVHGNCFLDGIEAYEAVWEHLPQVGIKFDPANWKSHGDDYLAVLERHAEKIAHVHIKEHIYRGTEAISQPPAGMGDIEWGKVMAWLYEADYDGYLSIEPHGPIWSKPGMREKMCLLTKKYLSQFLL